MIARPWSDPAFETAAALIAARTGLDTPPHRRGYVEACMQKAMSRAGIKAPADYAAHLAASGNDLNELVNELTVHESYFFRDPGQFDFIRRTVLPALRQIQGRPIRIWSAGCAAGEEAYSLAIMLEQEGLASNATVLGTDLSSRALARAREGRYSPWALRASPPAFVEQYFAKGGNDRAILPRLRQRVRFDYLNLAAATYPPQLIPPGSIDLILCRNVFIYFGTETIAQIACRLHDSLSDGGWLLTGPSDPLLPDSAGLHRTVTDVGVIYRRLAQHDRPAAPRPLPAESRQSPVPAVAAPGAAFPPERRHKPARPRAAPQPAERRASTGQPDGAAEQAARIRALADAGNREGAEQAVERAVADFPLSAEIHFLHALVLIDRGRPAAALQAVRRVLYLDRSLALAHWLHGTILEQQGDREPSRAAFRKAHRLLRDLPPTEIIPLSDGENVASIAGTLAARMAGWDLEGTETR